MSFENANREYVKIVADVIEKEMSLEPTDPSSKNPNDRRVFLANQNFTLPTYDYMMIILSEGVGSHVMANNNRLEVTNGGLDEVQEIIVRKEIGIDIMSKTDEARERKEEVLMALVSTASQNAQEANGFRIFGVPTTFIDVSQAEGETMIKRFRTNIVLHARYTKRKAIAFYEAFGYNINVN